MKINLKNLLIKYICYFSLVNILFYYILRGGYTSVFYVLTEALIISIAIKCYKISTKDALLLILTMMFIPIEFLLHQYVSEISIEFNFVFFVGVALVLNNDEFKTRLVNYIKKSEAQISVVSILYILIVAFSVFTGIGLREGWGTTTLKGPYGTPHMLAYELVILICLNLFLILKSKKIINIIITFVLISFVLFTAVRIALIALIIILVFFISRFGISNKLLVLIAVATIGVYLLFSTQILDPILAKTNLAIANGSISNGRLWIFESSINTFLNYKGFSKWIIGIGYRNLLEGNLRLIKYDIQAHNDILNALIAFGSIYCGVFIYSIFRMVKGSRGTLYKLVFLLALINLNGVVSYMSLAIPIIIIMVFFECEKLDAKRNELREKRKLRFFKKKSV